MEGEGRCVGGVWEVCGWKVREAVRVEDSSGWALRGNRTTYVTYINK